MTSSEPLYTIHALGPVLDSRCQGVPQSRVPQLCSASVSSSAALLDDFHDLGKETSKDRPPRPQRPSARDHTTHAFPAQTQELAHPRAHLRKLGVCCERAQVDLLQLLRPIVARRLPLPVRLRPLDADDDEQTPLQVSTRAHLSTGANLNLVSLCATVTRQYSFQPR